MSEADTTWNPMQMAEIDSSVLRVITAFIDKTPNLPVHVHKLLEIVSDSKSDSLDVANAASADPGLVSKILRVVNSSYYGLSNRTDNIHFAIVLLGFDEVRKIAVQTSFKEMFKEGAFGKAYTTDGLWKHSFLVSVCAESLWRDKDTKQAGDMLTFGILHDIGKFALFKLAIAMKKQGVSTFKQSEELDGMSLMEKEEALFRLNHPVVGALLAKKWELSERICNIIEYHHHPLYYPIDTIPEAVVTDVATIAVADALIHHMDGEEDIAVPGPEYFEHLGLSPSLEACVTDELQEKIEDARKFVSSSG